MNEQVLRRRLERLRSMISRKLAALIRQDQPEELREACRYVLSGGGKHIRGVIVLLSCEAVGKRAAEALHAAAAMEVLHNFTLVHDDVMDNSPLRRGRPTVHVRWNVNTALLAGDTLIGLGYRTLLQGDPRHHDALARTFTSCLLDVCEGQALDMAFGRRDDVQLSEYFTMIGKKTASLLAGAAEIGAIVGGASPKQRSALRRYGVHLGHAFQLQDDLLDVVADPGDLGKPIGGDIVEGKRTFLLLRAAEKATGTDRQFLRSLLRSDGRAPQSAQTGGTARTREQQLVSRVTGLFAQVGVLEEARGEIRRSTSRAVRSLNPLAATRARDMLASLAEYLALRRS